MIITRMVINMNEARLTTIEQIGPFLGVSTAIDFSAAGDDGDGTFTSVASSGALTTPVATSAAFVTRLAYAHAAFLSGSDSSMRLLGQQ